VLPEVKPKIKPNRRPQQAGPVLPRRRSGATRCRGRTNRKNQTFFFGDHKGLRQDRSVTLLANRTGGRKISPRSVDNHSFGIPDFEFLLNSHQAAQLLDIHHKTLQKLARRGEIHGSHVGKLLAFPRI